MKILLTGFDPFGGEQVNPALEAVKRVAAPDFELVKLTVPTVFEEAAQVVLDAIESHRPDAVVCVGQAGGRSQITPERVAINIIDARIPDNKGNQPKDCPVVKEGPAAYFSTLPIKDMVSAMEAAGIPAVVSNTAGTFVCNCLMYRVLHALAVSGRQIPAGFIHVPYIPEQTGNREEAVPSLPLDQIIRGLEAALYALPAGQ